jgi:putative membrane protein
MPRRDSMLKRFVLRLVVVGLALVVVVQLGIGVRVESDRAFLAMAVVLALLNAFVRPVLLVLTLPLSVATLGIFVIVLNAALIALAAFLLPGVAVTGFLGACGAALIISIISILLNYLLR